MWTQKPETQFQTIRWAVSIINSLICSQQKNQLKLNRNTVYSLMKIKRWFIYGASWRSPPFYNLCSDGGERNWSVSQLKTDFHIYKFVVYFTESEDVSLIFTTAAFRSAKIYKFRLKEDARAESAAKHQLVTVLNINSSSLFLSLTFRENEWVAADECSQHVCSQLTDSISSASQ